MLSACPSPTASKKTLVLASPTAKSQRELIIQTTSPRSNASKQNPLYHIMPSTSTPMGRAKLFKDLASPQHKHSNSHLSFKHLSNSIADIRNLVSMRESTEPNVQSPKMVKHQRVHTISGQEFYIRKPEVVQGEKITEAEKVTKTEGEPIEGAKLTAESPKSDLVMKRGMTLGEADTLAFREEMKKEYENNPLVRVDEEALYYDTIKNLDVCGRCWTNCQKHYTSPFKLKYKGNKCSNYQRDYVPHDPLQKSPTITGDHYEAYHSNHTVSLGSTMRGDYKPWPTNYMKHEGLKPTLGPDNSTFFGKSSYNNDFPGYRTPKGPVERSPQPITVLSELPFEGKSSYRDTFTDSQEPRAFVTRWPKKTAKSPLPTGVPFLGQTTTSDTYKPYKVVGGKGKGDKNNDYQPTKAFMNQFKTIYAKDFDGKGELPCPARVFIDNNPPPRMKHLNTSIKE